MSLLRQEEERRMATIRASCPDCGDVELTTRDMAVRVCSDDQRGSYVFRCPDCRMAVTKAAEPRIVDLLVSSGVALQTWRLPAELLEQRVGEPFTHDDLLEFHELLQDDAWYEQLTR
jgi:predicted RNA-binding Zn-ribbon protein involved in translation (DUF1610 family)